MNVLCLNVFYGTNKEIYYLGLLTKFYIQIALQSLPDGLKNSFIKNKKS